jgi:hypothetical protein
MEKTRNETAVELALYAVNDGELYASQAMTICRAMAKRQLAGTYDPTLAMKSWVHLATSAAHKYNAEFCSRDSVWHEVFEVADRKDAAHIIADHYSDQIEYELNTLKGN